MESVARTRILTVLELFDRPRSGWLGSEFVDEGVERVRDLYGRDVEVTLFDKLRDERRFDGPEALREQITRDCLALLDRVREREWTLV